LEELLADLKDGYATDYKETVLRLAESPLMNMDEGIDKLFSKG